MAKKYKYAGDGVGLPGLPNEVTDDEAKELGMGDVLESAVQLGLYVEVKPETVKVKKESEVKHG